MDQTEQPDQTEQADPADLAGPAVQPGEGWDEKEMPAASAFQVDVDGYEGPIDVLLTLAREQKVDLAQISIVQLADQYLEFVARASKVNLELAADYLVMAAWLAYLKSRLLLPDLDKEEEPTGEEMAAALAFQLRRLEAMQKSGAQLIARNRLGRDFFARGAPEKQITNIIKVTTLSLYDLLKAYGDLSRRGEEGTLHIEPWNLYTVEEALVRLRSLLGGTPDWESLWRFLPGGLRQGFAARSALAATFTASLEMVREGKLVIRQTGTFGPIYLRAANKKTPVSGVPAHE